MAKTQLLRKLLSLPLGLALRKIGEHALSKRVNSISLVISIASAVRRERIKIIIIIIIIIIITLQPWVDMLLDDQQPISLASLNTIGLKKL